MNLARAFAEIDSKDAEPAEVRIKSYMPVGSVSGVGKVNVSAFEVVVPARQIQYHAVRFEVSSGDEYTGAAIASVDFEEAEKLLASLSQLASTKIDTHRFALTEVDVTVSDLKVTVFNTEKGRLHASIGTNGVSCLLMNQADLLNLARLVELALNHLRKNSI